MHPESKVFLGGQQGEMTEVIGEHAGFTHQGDEAKRIRDTADVVGHSIYDGRKKKDGYDLRTRDKYGSFHVSSKDWHLDRSGSRYEKVADAVEQTIGKAPVTIVIY